MAVTVSPKVDAQASKWCKPYSCAASVLEIPLHGVKLHHAVGDGGAGGKHNAAARRSARPDTGTSYTGRWTSCASVWLMPPTFRILCKCGEVFIVMRLIDEDTVNAQLFKGHHIILAGLVIELVQLLLAAVFLVRSSCLMEKLSPRFFFNSEMPSSTSSSCCCRMARCRSRDMGIFSNWLCPMMTAS